MRYRLHPVRRYFDIVVEESNTVVGHLSPIHPGFSVKNDQFEEIAVVTSIDEALAAFAAHVSTHPPHWERTGATEYKKDTDYGDTLLVQQNSAGGWTAYRDDCELSDNNGPVSFPTARQAQHAADLHQHDGYPNSVCPGDSLSWLGWMEVEGRYSREHCLGEVVADAVDAKSRARREYGNGGVQAQTQDMIAGLIVHLHEIWEASRVGSFDPERCTDDPYFSDDGAIQNGQAVPSRMSFDDAAQHYGKIALRKRHGSDVSDAAIHDMISDLLTCILPRSPTSGRVSVLVTRAAARGELARETDAALGMLR
jgi:hypothetical protein